MRVEIVGTLLVRIVFFLLPSTFMLLADSILPSIVMHYKTQGDAGLPTRGRATSRHSPVWYQVIAVSLFNILFGLLIQAGIELLLTKVLHINSALQVSMGLPLPWTIFKQVAGALVLREVSISPTHLPSYLTWYRSCNITSIATSSTPPNPTFSVTFTSPTTTQSPPHIPSPRTSITQ